ncbi:MAG: cupredoxin domain-containing protein, partial [Nitrososphaeraceae archaeon]
STVTWFNADTAAHTVTSGNGQDGPDGEFDSSMFMSGTIFSHRFDRDGTYPYFCMVHPWMTGYVIVERGGSVTPPPNPIPTQTKVSVTVNAAPFYAYPGGSVSVFGSVSGLDSFSPVRIIISDPSGVNIITQITSTDYNGNFNTSVTLPRNLNIPGKYIVTANVNSEVNSSTTASFELRVKESTPSPSTARVSIAQESSVPGCEETNKCYIPFEVRVARGGEVTWSNDDSAAHTVTSGTAKDGPDGNFDSSLFMAGTTFSVKFNEDGTFPYFCMVHPWMIGEVVVGQGGTSPPPPTPRPDISILVESDSSLYDLGDIVNLNVKLSGTSKSQNVGISVADPTGHVVISRTLTTDSSGRANMEFGIHENFKTGTYTTTATVSIGGVTYKDTSRFKIESQFNQIRIISVQGTDQQGNPSSFVRGDLGFVKVVVSANKPIATLVTVNLFDSQLTTIGIASFRTTLSTGESEMILSFKIPEDAAVGTADIYANAFSDWPSNGGIPQTGEFSAQVRIT